MRIFRERWRGARRIRAKKIIKNKKSMAGKLRPLNEANELILSADKREENCIPEPQATATLL
ncbi:MAG: hypothetical protein JW999_07620 [Methanotrichaceae archaeon]|nr:hypothetical protein [Methanotrichaceae archaeon]